MPDTTTSAAVGSARAARGPIDRRLLRLAPSLRAHLARSVVLAALFAVVVVAQAQVIGDRLPLLIRGDRSAATPLAAALLVVGAARWLLRDLSERSATAAVNGARRSITDAVLDHVAVLDEAGAAAATPSRVTSLVTTGVDALDPWIRSYLPALCAAVVVPAVAWTRILVADPLSALVLGLAIPLIPVFMILIGQYTQERTDRQWAALQRLAGHFHDVLVGLVTLRLFGRADAQVDHVRRSAEGYREAVMRTLRVAFLSALALELLATLSVALVAVEVGIRLSAGQMALGTGLVVLLLAPEVSLPIRRVGAAYHAGLTGLDAAAEVADLLALPATPDGPIDEVPDGEVRLRALTVVDPERGRRAGPVDVVARPGELVALVGPSGSGKSTLLEAIRARVRPSDGTVKIGGEPVEHLARATRERLIVHVAQAPTPVGHDVRASIALGVPDTDTATAVALAAQLGLGDRLDDPTASLSGGELRRVTLVRAAARVRAGRASILVADEPTSHLDPDLRATVVELLSDLAKRGATVIVATHDPLLAAAADRVVELGGDRDAHPADRPAARPDAALDQAVGPTRTALPERPQRLVTAGLALPGPATGSEPEADGHPAGLMGELRWLRSVAGPSQGRLLLARVLGVLADACTIGLAATAAWLIVRASEQPSFADLAVAAVAVRAFGLGKGVLRYWERLAAHDATFRLLGAVRATVVERLARVVPGGLARLSRGDLMSRVVDDVDRLADLELRVVGPSLSAFVVGLLAAGGVAVFVPAGGAVLAVLVVVGVVVLPGAASAAMSRLAPRRVEVSASLGGHTMELTEHLDEIVGCGAARRWRSQVDGELTQMEAIERSAGHRLGRVEGAASSLGAVSAAAVVAAVGGVVGSATQVPNGPMIAVAVVVPLAVAELMVPLVQSGALSASVRASTARLRTVLSAEDPVPEPVVPAPLPTGSGLELGSLCVRWPGAPDDTLHEIELSAPEGSLVTISGPSGSGKSTLAAALVGFLAPRVGEYRLGGVSAAQLGGDQVRQRVTWAQQQPWLAATSLRENLRLARPDATDAELWRALEQVAVADWVGALPDGLDTLLGAGGAGVSGGQRQRLALARILLAGHRVVVLDEPTAQLDRATADRVLGQMLLALDGRTVVVLGHSHPAALPGVGAIRVDLADGRVLHAAVGSDASRQSSEALTPTR